MAVPLYKYTSIPRATTFDAASAFYGAQKQRARRQAVLQDAQTGYESGQSSFNDFTSTANRILGQSIGLPERSDINKLQSSEQEREYATQDSALAGKYQRGEISYDEYVKYLTDTLGRYNSGSDQYKQREGFRTQVGIDKISQEYNSLLSDYNNGQLDYNGFVGGIQSLAQRLQNDIVKPTSGNIDDLKINDKTVGQILQDLRESYNVQNVNKAADDYTKGKTSFEDYSSFLKNQLNLYREGTAQYDTLATAWEDAYSTELSRYRQEIEDQFNAGQLTAEEYAQFNNWYKNKLGQGRQRTNQFEEFTPTSVTTSLPAGTVKLNKPPLPKNKSKKKKKNKKK